jgi:hypothetical protein
MLRGQVSLIIKFLSYFDLNYVKGAENAVIV